jgi:hypothetical protein
MATYSAVRNPLLDDDNIKSSKLGSNHPFKESTVSFQSFISQSSIKLSKVGTRLNHSKKKIVPSSSKDHRKKKVSDDSDHHQHQQLQPLQPIKQRNEQSEPLVHYNGPLETLDQLPEEKLNWITKETSDHKELRHYLLDYPRSIVFRKPHNRNQ